MKASIRTSAAWLTSLLSITLPGCAMNRADSLRMLDRRADYDSPTSAGRLSLKEGDGNNGLPGKIPVRSQPKVAEVWIHAHEMASHDYFWGGWMSVVVEPDQWEMKRQDASPSTVRRYPRSNRRFKLATVPPTVDIFPEASKQ